MAQIIMAQVIMAQIAKYRWKWHIFNIGVCMGLGFKGWGFGF